jgi:hypothetical protein
MFIRYLLDYIFKDSLFKQYFKFTFIVSKSSKTNNIFKFILEKTSIFNTCYTKRYFIQKTSTDNDQKSKYM